MAEEHGHSWRLQSGHYLGEISALSLLPQLPSLPYLLAGTGSQLLLYDLELGKMINSFDVFQGIRVHGISFSNLGSQHFAVYGERRVKLFSLVDVDLKLLQSLPKFANWVLDVCFFNSFSHQETPCLAVGCTDNSVHLWDIANSCILLQVQSSDRSLLYSMRLWGDNLESLRIASGTIYNEIIVWKVVSQNDASPMTSQVEVNVGDCSLLSNSLQHNHQKHKPVRICKLVGHEGSIFRLAWSSDGTRLISASDDRSARVWNVYAETEDIDKPSKFVGLELFGHSARVWDCDISDKVIVTAGEDCTCRVWGLDGQQVQIIKEHVGRGIWRCLYDPNFSILITAGFDSSIKVHQLHNSLSRALEGHYEAKDICRSNICTARLPNSLEHIGLMDSKSEYVRCVHFACEDTLYVATNHGYLYHAKLSDAGNVKWTKIIRVVAEVPIICMDLLSKPLKPCCGVEDWIAVGDGKGNMTIAKVINDKLSSRVDLTFTWSAGPERQLLGTHWCKPLGCGYIFTADPRGSLMLWRLCDPLQSFSLNSADSCNVSLVAEFISCFGMRIMCLDASFENEVLVCGDIRGNLLIFPLLKSSLMDISSEVKTSVLNYFKGAHGISSVTSLSVTRLNSNQTEIHSTGGDGCICYLEYDRDGQSLEFIGMKQVKELSMIQSVDTDKESANELSVNHYAAGFTSVDFMIWNLQTETKVLQIPCGGWRRPHSYYLGDLPELKNCFAYVKDEVIYIHRYWVPDGERKLFLQNLHMQFHGREMHSLCFIVEEMQAGANGKHSLFSRSCWIATGCEDGTVRLTRYTPDIENWSESKLLGEHVGGSAVRSICFVSKIHLISADASDIADRRNQLNTSAENKESPQLLISVGAKRVLTSWLLRNRKPDKSEDTLGNDNLGVPSSMSFQWLSTDMPPKYSRANKGRGNNDKEISVAENVSNGKDDVETGKGKLELKSCIADKCEDDWRYLAVTAFLVKCAGSRITVCFVVVACSDATLTLRALVLPHRLWFDVALLAPLSSPVLSLQHVIIPTSLPSKVFTETIQDKSMYIVISGATDGSIAFWDLTGSVEAFMQRVSVLHLEKLIDCQKRPRTGRGSQGGRWWRSLGSSMSKSKSGSGSSTVKSKEDNNVNLSKYVSHGSLPMANNSECGTTTSQDIHVDSLKSDVNDSSSDLHEVCPLHFLKSIHQSGVNSLHVSDVKSCQSLDGGLTYIVVSGGDDQALHCLRFELSLSLAMQESEIMKPNSKKSIPGYGKEKNFIDSSKNQNQNYVINFLNREKVASAHSSAIKGIWTDGSWVFSTGLDQRIRCWHLEEQGKLTEYAYMIISVPEPEALDVRVCSRDHYQIAIAGRGMQMIEFSAFHDLN
ncbi:hypothetical protein UlMin_030829 [Ulmus minor]